MEKAESVREIASDVIPQMANFVFLAEGHNVVRLTREILCTPCSLFFEESKGADTQFAGKQAPAHCLMIHPRV